ncbi:MAG: hypothetical protein CL840_01790 [Crocinitomicaceae bacterium]|nr:hypothetical protein [Crocinitomicaceae bacterium]|tara:strand:- start:12692 stop:13333 length:642 start_codon:yes stop_codon:yes gene_type:complete
MFNALLLHKKFFVVVAILALTGAVYSQTDSARVVTEEDVVADQVVAGTVADSSVMKKHSPKKAALFSAIIPGGGQVYNKKYWKVPVIYAVGFGMAYLVSYNYGQYQLYRESLETRVNQENMDSSGTDHFPTISKEGLRTESQRFQKNYELAIVGVALVYILQIVDASVDAHFKTFDVSDDLSMSVRPSIMGNPYQMAQGIAPTVGFKLNLRFK